MSNRKIPPVLRNTTKFNLARILQRLDITRNRRYALANVRRDFVCSHTWTQGNCVKNSLGNPIIYLSFTLSTDSLFTLSFFSSKEMDCPIKRRSSFCVSQTRSRMNRTNGAGIRSSLRQCRELVRILRPSHALIILAVDLPPQGTHAPCSANRLECVERPLQVFGKRQKL